MGKKIKYLDNEFFQLFQRSPSLFVAPFHQHQGKQADQQLEMSSAYLMISNINEPTLLRI